ncbi:substrate-binding domain-containing protein [Vibrio rumoiensis]|uniref:Substrate-binding domain-containing protein n=1 Tax=Vibrio rumoiensis TaxID=76258 RepID=A0ABW7J059_9VIBR
MKNKRPSLQDIADEVGITKMTVSRCLRDSSKVSPVTYQKIMAAIDKLGYIPNKAPDLLSHAKSHAIGVLVPSLTNQVFADVIRGIESITEQAGYQTMLAHYGYSQEIEEDRISHLLSYHVDGLVLSESQHSERTYQMLQTAGIPVVEIMDLQPSPIHQCVGFDNHKAGYEITRLMIQQGHLNIVYIGARLDIRTQQKLAGYTQAMRESKLEPRKILTDEASSYSLGSKLLHETLKQYPDVDGVFCTNDDLAVGIVFECQRLDISIPEQLAVAGFHGHDVGQAMQPQLASVKTPRLAIGEFAAQQLIDRLNGIESQQSCFDLGFEVVKGQTI